MRSVNDFSYDFSTPLASDHHMVKESTNNKKNPYHRRMSNLEGKKEKGERRNHKNTKQITETNKTKY